MTQRQAFFLTAEKGQRFCIFTPSLQQPARAAVLYLHPFAEELNKSRRMVALQVRALAAAGFDVLQIDLFGCGDSSGLLEDATWVDWLDDGELALQWLIANSARRIWIWGLRSGALLAAELARRSVVQTSHLYWQPVLNGGAILREFQRLAVAGELLSGRGKQKLAEFKLHLAAGLPIEVAGYQLSPALVKSLDTCKLVDGGCINPLQVVWLDVVAISQSQPSPLVAEALASLQATGCQTFYKPVIGSAFWQSEAVAPLSDLIEQTTKLMAERS